MFSKIIEFCSGIFYWFIGIIENIMGDISMPKWFRVFLIILLASVLISIAGALIKLVVGIGTVLLSILGVLVTVFFVVCLIYAISELIKKN
ncbi:MAG: hypothetical protein J6J60_09295 [Clostridia bacterium]|nr:hypothetical protein [Clostridia bacterium]